jgi:predicted dehydrogenase
MTPSRFSRRAALRGAAALAAAPWFATRLRAAEAEFTVGVIGHTGRGNYGHGLDTLWLSLPETRIAAVADPDEKGRAAARKRLGLAEDAAFSDYREMLEKIRPDLVAVCPRHVDQHRDMAVAAAEAGAKGIYIEKPFCRDLAEADDILAACAAGGARLAIAHRNRYHPALPVAARAVEEGRIGRLLEIRSRGKEDARCGGLDLWVLGSHLFNLAPVFAGAPRACSATVWHEGRPATADDVVDGAEGIGPLIGDEVRSRFDMEAGIPLYFDSMRNAGVREVGFGLQLIGTDGVMDLRIDVEPLIHVRPGNPFRPVVEAGAWQPFTSAGLNRPEPREDIRDLVCGHLGPARDLLDAVRTRREPLCGPADGRLVVEMILAVFESHLRGGARVNFPLGSSGNPLKVPRR